MDAQCPQCFGARPDCEACSGSGTVAVRLAEGVWYSRDCLDCKMHIGVAIVGENGASLEEIQQHPEDMVCPFCDGQAKYTTEQPVDDLDMYRLPIRYEDPCREKTVRAILSQRLHRPRRSIPRSIKSFKKKWNTLFR